MSRSEGFWLYQSFPSFLRCEVRKKTPCYLAWRSLATTESGHLRPQTKKQDLGHL